MALNKEELKRGEVPVFLPVFTEGGKAGDGAATSSHRITGLLGLEGTAGDHLPQSKAT